MIGLNWKDEDALATQWLQQLGNPYAHVALDREGRVAIDFGVYGAPETFLVDAGGMIVYKHVGPHDARGLAARVPRAAARRRLRRHWRSARIMIAQAAAARLRDRS